MVEIICYRREKTNSLGLKEGGWLPGRGKARGLSEIHQHHVSLHY